MSDVIELAGLWKSEQPTRKGKDYYRGKIKETVTLEAGSLVCLFLNESDNPKAPKFSVTVLPPREQDRPAARHYGDDGAPQERPDMAPWETF